MDGGKRREVHQVKREQVSRQESLLILSMT